MRGINDVHASRMRIVHIVRPTDGLAVLLEVPINTLTLEAIIIYYALNYLNWEKAVWVTGSNIVAVVVSPLLIAR